jgi:hypothetical protein
MVEFSSVSTGSDIRVQKYWRFLWIPYQVSIDRWLWFDSRFQHSYEYFRSLTHAKNRARWKSCWGRKKIFVCGLIGRKKILLGFQIREDLLWHVFNRENEFSELICCIVVCVLFGTLWDAAGNDFSRVKMVLEFGCKEASNIIGTDEQGDSFSTI